MKKNRTEQRQAEERQADREGEIWEEGKNDAIDARLSLSLSISVSVSASSCLFLRSFQPAKCRGMNDR